MSEYVLELRNAIKKAAPQRFVRALFQDDLVFPGYDQDAWVAVQGIATPHGEIN